MVQIGTELVHGGAEYCSAVHSGAECPCCILCCVLDTSHTSQCGALCRRDRSHNRRCDRPRCAPHRARRSRHVCCPRHRHFAGCRCHRYRCSCARHTAETSVVLQRGAYHQRRAARRDCPPPRCPCYVPHGSHRTLSSFYPFHFSECRDRPRGFPRSAPPPARTRPPPRTDACGVPHVHVVVRRLGSSLRSLPRPPFSPVRPQALSIAAHTVCRAPPSAVASLILRRPCR